MGELSAYAVLSSNRFLNMFVQAIRSCDQNSIAAFGAAQRSDAPRDKIPTDLLMGSSGTRARRFRSVSVQRGTDKSVRGAVARIGPKVIHMQIAQIAPLTESIPPKLYRARRLQADR
jgi:hypothetical protein